jgi:two-component system, chemotaxis family, protein-glutamate methylesterase/glutaminase
MKAETKVNMGTVRESKKIRVLIVDDSASVRKTLTEIIEGDAELTVMATASDPYVAVERIRREVPDVIILDIEMPRMDGLTFLRKIMAQRPIPVVICSSVTEAGSDTMIEALEAGAVDIVPKPRIDTAHFLLESRMRICDALKAAAQTRLGRGGDRSTPLIVEAKLTADAILPQIRSRRVSEHTEPVVCIGASTGGTEALRVVLEALPADSPAIVIVQHMPEKFTAAFARRLNSLCAVEVKEGEEGDTVLAGRVLIAPGNHHMLLQRSGKRYSIAVHDGPPVCRHRPSVDVLFRSAAQCAGANAAGFLLTGMGDDGARGLLEMRETGSFTVAQDENSSVVFGMPHEAILRGAASRVLPLERMAGAIIEFSRTHIYESRRSS